MTRTRRIASGWTIPPLVFALHALGNPVAGAEPAPRPNFVVFLADDLGWADVPWHGSPARMPHLEALARDGSRLEAHYVHPMCSPTRAAFLSGRYASRFGVTAAQNPRVFRWNTVTLARLLKSAGYDTALVGKWHLGSRPEEGPQKFGFDHGYGSLAGGVTPDTHRYKEGPFTQTWHRNGRLVDEPGHVTDLLAREATRWVEQRGERPFFLYVPFTAIHVPMAEPENWLEANAHIADPGRRLRAAAASHMDDAIGQILAAIDRRGLRKSTLVLFLGDNGAHPPSANQGGPYPGNFGPLLVGNDNHPWRGHKSGVYEGGIRTPGLASWPGRLAPGTIDVPLHISDWMPTFAALAGARPAQPLDWDGRDVWRVLTRDDARPEDRPIYTAGVGFRSAAIRHGRWKLVVSNLPGDGRGQRKNEPVTGPPVEELFDLAADPSESRNLARERPEVLAEMRQRLARVASRDRDAVAND